MHLLLYLLYNNSKKYTFSQHRKLKNQVHESTLRARTYTHIGKHSSSTLRCALTISFSQWAATGVDTREQDPFSTL